RSIDVPPRVVQRQLGRARAGLRRQRRLPQGRVVDARQQLTTPNGLAAIHVRLQHRTRDFGPQRRRLPRLERSRNRRAALELIPRRDRDVLTPYLDRCRRRSRLRRALAAARTRDRDERREPRPTHCPTQPTTPTPHHGVTPDGLGDAFVSTPGAGCAGVTVRTGGIVSDGAGCCIVFVNVGAPGAPLVEIGKSCKSANRTRATCRSRAACALFACACCSEIRESESSVCGEIPSRYRTSAIRYACTACSTVPSLAANCSCAASSCDTASRVSSAASWRV